MKINLEIFNDLVERKLVSVQKHNTMDRLIWNYTQRVQFDKLWTPETMMARGLITDLAGNIVARPFRKFFNLGEHDADSMKDLPTDKPIIYEKMDGSLGIQYYDGHNVSIATRGSFNSDQAKWATMWMRQRGFDESWFLPGFTYLWEIVYPENRIVVDYGDRAELVLLAVINTETGDEMPGLHEEEGKKLKVSFVKSIEYDDLEKIVEQAKSLNGNQEGYVFFWPNHDNIRAKIKGDEYVRLHRLITGFSTKSIWECMMNKQDIDAMLQNIPDEFFDWIDMKRTEMLKQWEVVFNQAKKVYDEVKTLPTRKEQALIATQNPFPIPQAVFALLDDKDVWTVIWRTLKPKYELPFKKDIDA